MKRLLVLFTAYGLLAQSPTGTVVFRDGDNVLCSAPLTGSTATCPVSTLTVGPHALTATYSGDGSYAGSNSAWAQTVNAIGPIPEFMIPASATVGQLFQYPIAASNNPTSYSSTELPPGLTINSATGLVSGTPTSSGVFNATLLATNANGSGAIILSLTVNPGAPPPPPGVSISSITSPVSIGQSVTIKGNGFAARDIIWFTSPTTGTNGLNVASNDGITITFNTNVAFQRGTYSLYVQNATGNSNSVTFTVQ